MITIDGNTGELRNKWSQAWILPFINNNLHLLL